jgi:hypothetical protein
VNECYEARCFTLLPSCLNATLLFTGTNEHCWKHLFRLFLNLKFCLLGVQCTITCWDLVCMSVYVWAGRTLKNKKMAAGACGWSDHYVHSPTFLQDAVFPWPWRMVKKIYIPPFTTSSMAVASLYFLGGPVCCTFSSSPYTWPFLPPHNLHLLFLFFAHLRSYR